MIERVCKKIEGLERWKESSTSPSMANDVTNHQSNKEDGMANHKRDQFKRSFPSNVNPFIDNGTQSITSGRKAVTMWPPEEFLLQLDINFGKYLADCRSIHPRRRIGLGLVEIHDKVLEGGSHRADGFICPR